MYDLEKVIEKAVNSHDGYDLDTLIPAALLLFNEMTDDQVWETLRKLPHHIKNEAEGWDTADWSEDF